MGPHRRLTLLRHGKAHPAVDGEDHLRALTKRGERQAEEVGRRLRARGWIPDRILASPAARTWATDEIVARACGLGAHAVHRADALYGADPETIWRVATGGARDARHVLVCGHNPGLSDLAGRFGPRPGARRLSTGAFASALWDPGGWDEIDPEDAVRCDCEEPEDDAADPPSRVHD